VLGVTVGHDFGPNTLFLRLRLLAESASSLTPPQLHIQLKDELLRSAAHIADTSGWLSVREIPSMNWPYKTTVEAPLGDDYLWPLSKTERLDPKIHKDGWVGFALDTYILGFDPKTDMRSLILTIRSGTGRDYKFRLSKPFTWIEQERELIIHHRMRHIGQNGAE